MPARRRHRQQPHRAGPAGRRRGPSAHWRVVDRRAAHRRRVGGAAARAAGARRHPDEVDGIVVCATVPSVLHDLARDARAGLRRRRPGGRRARRAHRHPGADGQSARGRLRPDRQRPGRRDDLRRPGRRRRLRRDRHDLRRRQRRRAVRRRRDHAGNRDLPGGARSPRRTAAQGRAGPAALGHRQEHRRGAAVRHGLRGRRPGRGHRRTHDRRARRRRPTTSR